MMAIRIERNRARHIEIGAPPPVELDPLLLVFHLSQKPMLLFNQHYLWFLVSFRGQCLFTMLCAPVRRRIETPAVIIK